MAVKAPDPTPEQLGRVIKKIMEDKRLKHAGVAYEAAMSPGTLSSIVNGKIENKRVVMKHFHKLCDILEVDSAETLHRAKYEGSYGLESAKEGMEIGNTLTLWHNVIGNGLEVIECQNIEILFDESKKILMPISIENLMLKVLQENEEGKHNFKNNPVLTIFDGCWYPFEGVDERLSLNLTLGITDYALLYALRNTEQGQEIVHKLLNNWSPRTNIDPLLSQGIGICVVILSSDGHMVFGRRSMNMGARANEIDSGATEGFAMSDIAEDDKGQLDTLNVKDIMKRALFEEFGITESKIDKIKLLNFGYDMGWAQWSFTGLCEVDLTAKDIMRRHKSVAPQHMEYKETYAVKHDPVTILNWLADESRGVWSCGLAAAYYALIHIHGIDNVEEASKGLSFNISHNLVWR